MEVTYLHTFTVVVEDQGNFSDSETLARIERAATDSASHYQMMVKHGTGESKPVRSMVRTETVVRYSTHAKAR